MLYLRWLAVRTLASCLGLEWFIPEWSHFRVMHARGVIAINYLMIPDLRGVPCHCPSCSAARGEAMAAAKWNPSRN